MATKAPVHDPMEVVETRGTGTDGGVGGGTGDGNGGVGSSSRVSTTASIVPQDRLRFTVELKPGETTFVSWKKLIKDSKKSSNQPPPPLPPPPSAAAAPSLAAAPVDPGQPVVEAEDAPASNRFSAVIEKIERLYMGNQSSDEEELDDAPDDDQYDTEDSFIDDADLDEYFQVDKSTTKHTGFFINKGKLEQINEPVQSPNHQPRKRRRKDLKNAPGDKDEDQIPNKHAKMVDARMPASMETPPLVGNKSSNISKSPFSEGEHEQNGKSQNLNAGHKMKSGDRKVKLDRSSPSKTKIRNGPTVLREANDKEKQKPGLSQLKDSSNKMKFASDPPDGAHTTKVLQREKTGTSELPDLNLSTGKHPIQTANTPPSHVKDRSSARPKGTMLERAIRELEKIVAESRPPTSEIQDTDNSFQAVKRRLPREVKQKLAKVARLASSQGKIQDELIQRLMSILGHIVQLRTLKRNLKEMVELGLSAKQEKENKFQQIKEEVMEMIKKCDPLLNTKAVEQQEGASDDFREGANSKDKGAPEGNCTMDDAMEDKICELYDLYVEGMDEERGPRSRKLYVELAELWPIGCMDNNGIKNAVYRAKERKRAQRKDQEKIKRKKPSSTSRIGDTVRGEASSVAQPRLKQERIVSESSKIVASPNRSTSSLTPSKHASSVRTSNTSISGSSLDRSKLDKVKVNSSTFLEEARKTMDGTLVKKKLKRKPGSDLGDIPSRSDKLLPQQGKERQKLHKHNSNHPNKSSLQCADILNREQPC